MVANERPRSETPEPNLGLPGGAPGNIILPLANVIPPRTSLSEARSKSAAAGVVGDAPLSTQAVRQIIKRRAAAADLEGHFSGHSLRVESAQSLASQGASLVEMQNAGRWQSPAMPGHRTGGSLPPGEPSPGSGTGSKHTGENNDHVATLQKLGFDWGSRKPYGPPPAKGASLVDTLAPLVAVAVSAPCSFTPGGAAAIRAIETRDAGKWKDLR